MALWHRKPKQQDARRPARGRRRRFRTSRTTLTRAAPARSSPRRSRARSAAMRTATCTSARSSPPTTWSTARSAPWCIADGSAALRLQVEFTDVRNDDVPDDVPGRVLDEIAERTPGFSGHQQEHWLYHCADGAAFIGPHRGRGGDGVSLPLPPLRRRLGLFRFALATRCALRVTRSSTTIRRSDRPGPLGPFETAANQPFFERFPAASAMTATTQHPGRERPPSPSRTLRTHH